VAFMLPKVCISAQVWSGETTITKLYPTSTDYIFNVSYSNSVSTCDGGTRFSIRKTYSDNYNALVSSLIAAFIAGKKITFVFDDSQAANCFPYIDRFQILP